MKQRWMVVVMMGLLWLLAGRPLQAQVRDQIDFAAAVMGNPSQSPDIRAWPILGGVTRVHFADREVYERGNVNVWFAGRDLLSPAYGSQGAIAWTLWMGVNRSGTWVFAPIVECIRDYVPTGFLFAPNHVAQNLLYYVDVLDPRIAAYQPTAGEMIALVATTGDTRRQSEHPPGTTPSRTNVVLVPFSVGDYSFENAPAPSTEAPVEPTAETLRAKIEHVQAVLTAAFTELHAQVQALASRVGVLEARPLKTRCRAAVFGVIPTTCELTE